MHKAFEISSGRGERVGSKERREELNGLCSKQTATATEIYDVLTTPWADQP